MNIIQRLGATVSAIAAALGLAGCYESRADLIGSKARELIGADTTIVFRNAVYVAQSNGAEITVCKVERPADAMRPCSSPQHVKLERTDSGNYIVQIFDGKRYVYGLWHVPLSRSRDTLGTEDCLMMLGENIVGNGNAVVSIALGRIVRGDIEHSRNEPYQRLIAALGPYSAKEISNRTELLEIVSLYERHLFGILGSTCPGDRLFFGNKAGVSIRGDHRNLPPVE